VIEYHASLHVEELNNHKYTNIVVTPTGIVKGADRS